MKVICAIFFSALLCFSNAAGPIFTLSTLTDSNSPLSLQPASGSAVTVASGASSAASALGTSSASYTASFAAGLPTTFSLTFQNDQTSQVTDVLTLKVGTQVSLNVYASGPGTAAAANAGPTVPVTTAAASVSTAPTTSTTTCGNYYLDCAAGTITIAFAAIAGTATPTYGFCAVTITQAAAVVGILQYPTASAPASPYTSVVSYITAANTQVSTSAPVIICGTGPLNTNTLLYFVSQYTSGATSAQQTTAAASVKTAAMSGGIASNTGYFVNNLATAAGAGTNSPSSTFSSQLSTVSKSQSRMVVFAGLVATTIATLFGLVL